MVLPPANSLTERDRQRRHAKTYVWQARRPVALWQLASFNAPTVAVVWALAFAWLSGVGLETWVLSLLACGTWTVYVGDRLLDAHRAIRTGRLGELRERHYFHWRHRRVLIPLACCTAALAAALVIDRMPIAIRKRDSVLAAAALIYFSGVHSAAKVPAWLRRVVPKELLVGLLFTGGCAAPAISLMHFAAGRLSREWPFFVCFAFFAALAWVNCYAIECWESHGKQAGVVLRAGILSIAGAAISAALLETNSRAAALALAGTISSLLLLFLDCARFRISALTLPTLADIVLLTPVLLLPLGAHRV